MDIIKKSQNTEELKADMDDLLNRIYGVDLKNLDGAMDDLLTVMIKNYVVLPREFIMIGRGIALIEDTGKKLAPEFTAATELKKLSRKIIINKYKPERLAKVGINYMLQLAPLAKDLPDTKNNTISKLEEGEMEVNLKHQGISELTNQLSVSLIVSALIVGSSLTIMSNTGPSLFGISALGLIGFVCSALLGAYLVIAYMIKRE